MGKFQTSVVGATSLVEVIWEMPSSRPWGERAAGASGLPKPGGSGRRAGLQGCIAGPYRCGNPVLAVDEAVLAVEVVKSRELWQRGAVWVWSYWG